MSNGQTLSTLLIRQFRKSSLQIKTICLKMEPKVNLLEDPVYKKLKDYYAANNEKINIYQLFQQDPDRFKKFR